MNAVLNIEAGQGEPRICRLEPDQTVTLGRHRNNTVVLQDEHASRWHAEIFCAQGHWFLRDFGALNRTLVNGTAITQQADLEDGFVIQIGRTALRFTLAENGKGHAHAELAVSPEVDDSAEDCTVLQQDELTVLCEFMSAAVKQEDHRALIQLALEAAYRHTHATCAGFLSLDEQDPLPKVVVPVPAQMNAHLSRALTQAVRREGRAVRAATMPGNGTESDSLLSHADALGVPVKAGASWLGAIHVYKARERFTDREMHFCEALAAHLASSLDLLRARRTLEAENSRLRSHIPGDDTIVGASPVLQTLHQQIARLAVRPCTVLIVGESGVGKELVALALHRQSPRSRGPLVSVNCAAIAPTLLESQLFGHRKGAFTGADRNHPGLFEQSDEGTLFLDEVGELSLECQAKVLRVLEGKGYRPVGATEDIHIDVRIVAATHRELEREVEENRFRQDLFYRLQGIRLRMPPLREHLEDIPELVNHFLDKLAVEWGRHVSMSPDALDRLAEYSWPGNVRQLRSVLENAVALSDKDLLTAEDLVLPAESNATLPASLALKDIEAWAIRQALRRSKSQITAAAQLLGISRDTLYEKMKKYGIARPE